MRVLLLAVAVVIVGLLGGASSAVAAPNSTYFTATLSGTEEVPPNASTATGFAIVELNAAQTTITVDLTFSGLSSNATGAHIHQAQPGMSGGIVFGLSGVPAATSGSIPQQSFAISAAQVAALQSGDYYVNVHSGMFSDGEIRGQLAPANSKRTTTLTGAQEVPPTPSTGTGTSTVILSEDQAFIAVELTFSGLTSNATGAHIHQAPPGMSGGIVFGLNGVPAASSGTVPRQFFPITPAQVTTLQSGNYYVNVHSVMFSDGEIRGQIPAQPTAVRISHAAATRTPHGVLVRWRAESEAQTLGFNLYRSSNGRLVRLNRGLIHSVGGHRYSWLDRWAPRGRVGYRLEAVSLDGTRSWIRSMSTRR